MNTKTAVERVGGLKHGTPYNSMLDVRRLQTELDAARATLKEIADEGGRHDCYGCIRCDGEWCADLARRRLGVAE